MPNKLLILSCMLIISSTQDIRYSPLEQTYDELYHDAMHAYHKGDHSSAIKYFNYAISDFHYDRDIKAQCWIRCYEKYRYNNQHIFQLFEGQLDYLHYFVNMKFCSDKCKQYFLGNRGEILQDVNDLFTQRTLYSYLQYSYFKVGQLNDSLDTAYTFYTLHLDDKSMRNHINLMLKKLGRHQNTLKSLEELPHITSYKQAVKSYNDKKYRDCIANFEESLLFYFKEIEKCHALCEEQTDNAHASFSASLFKHLTLIIKCRQECRQNLTAMDGKSPSKNFFINYFHYLQFCYYQVGRVRDAAMNAKTYLMMNPSDRVMSRNMMIYERDTGIKPELFKVRQKPSQYYKENLIEVRMFEIVNGFANPKLHQSDVKGTLLEEIEAIYKSVSEDVTPKLRPIKGDLDTKKSVHSTPLSYRNQYRWEKLQEENKGVKILHEETSLNGTDRVAFDGVATEEQCEKLMTLVQKLAISGDGYKHNHENAAHPFTKKEIFKGVTVATAVQRAMEGKISVEEVDLYIQLSEHARYITQEYFDLPVRLNFAFTHLVCREALEKEIDENSEHISHPLHSDNCVLGADGEGTCPKRSPAYTWRDYSGLLYLNGNFTGGDFFFANYKKEIQARVRPKCGRFVAFKSNGVENLHGVLGVKKGIRCALPIWFTLSQDISEDNRHDAEVKLNELKKKLLEKNRSWSGTHRLDEL